MNTTWRGFMVTPRSVEQIDADGEMTWSYSDDTLFDDLIAAGYPGVVDPSGFMGGIYIDLSVDPDRLDEVTVYTMSPGESEHHMRSASAMFLRWYAANVTD